MNKERMETLFYNAMSWVWEHCEGYGEYIYALHNIGYTRDEIVKEFTDNVALDDEEIKKWIDYYDNEVIGKC